MKDKKFKSKDGGYAIVSMINEYGEIERIKTDKDINLGSVAEPNRKISNIKIVVPEEQKDIRDIFGGLFGQG